MWITMKKKSFQLNYSYRGTFTNDDIFQSIEVLKCEQFIQQASPFCKKCIVKCKIYDGKNCEWTKRSVWDEKKRRPYGISTMAPIMRQQNMQQVKITRWYRYLVLRALKNKCYLWYFFLLIPTFNQMHCCHFCEPWKRSWYL